MEVKYYKKHGASWKFNPICYTIWSELICKLSHVYISVTKPRYRTSPPFSTNSTDRACKWSYMWVLVLFHYVYYARYYNRQRIAVHNTKGGVLNFMNLAQVSSKKIIDIHYYCQGHGNSKWLAFIQDFTAQWAIKKNKWQMFKVLYSVWIFTVRIENISIWWYWIGLNQLTFPVRKW